MSKRKDNNSEKPFPLKQLIRLLLFIFLIIFLGKTFYNFIFPKQLEQISNIRTNSDFIAHQQKVWDSLQLTLTPLYTPVQFPSKQSLTLPSTLQIRTEDIKLNFNQGLHWTLRDLPQRPSLDLVCVVDTSGSMNGDKITFVKQSLIEMIEFLADGDRISIIEFNNAPTVIAIFVKTEGNRQKLIDSINNLSAGGGTNIFEAMDQAYTLLSQRTTQADITSVFLLTDGLDNFLQGQQLINKINSISLNREFSTNIHTFGYGRDHDSFFLSSFARNNGGEYYYVEEIENIRKYFINAFGQILSIAFSKIEIQLSIDESVQRTIGKNIIIKETFGNMWKKGNNENQRIIEMEQFQYGVAKDFVLELEFPFIDDQLIEQVNNLKLFHIEVYYQTQNTLQNFSKKIPITFKFAKSIVQINEKESLNEQVLTHYYRMKLVKVFEQAQVFVTKGNQKESKQLLQEFKQKLEVIYKERNIKDFKEMIDEIEKAIHKQSEQGAENYFYKESQRRATQKFHPDSLKGASASLNSLQEYMDEL